MAHQDAVQMADLLVEQKTSTKKKGAAATKAPTSTTTIQHPKHQVAMMSHDEGPTAKHHNIIGQF